MSDSIMTSYGPRSHQLVSGDGCYLFDEAGKRYFDALCGIGVCNLGHNHPQVTQAICEQASTLLHCSNLYQTRAQSACADALTQWANMQSVFFANSGAEANEAALKLARLWAKKQGVDYGKVIVFDRSFHGRTFATLSATGNKKIHQGFTPLLDQFYRATFNDLDSVKALASHNDIAAIFVEPVQGEAGVYPAQVKFMQGLRELCNKHNWLLMLDEVQTGNGRTGPPFAYMHYGITPDVLTTAKGLGNGVPIGACLANGEAAKLFAPGHHGSTFGGNPLACRAAHAVINTLSSEAQVTAQRRAEQALSDGLAKIGIHPKVAETRQLGMMAGITLRSATPDFLSLLSDEGVLANMTSEFNVRLLPPLISTPTQISDLCDTIITCLNKITE